jgi:hypothetical protein
MTDGRATFQWHESDGAWAGRAALVLRLVLPCPHPLSKPPPSWDRARDVTDHGEVL